MEAFKYNGIWWLPDNPGKKVSGILNFHPEDGIFLDLIGSLKDIKEVTSISQYNIILGVTSNSKNITLYRCIENNTHLSMPGFLSSSFISDFMFIGYHFNNEEDIYFSSLSINYFHLEEWLNIKCFKSNMEHDSKKYLKKYDLSYIPPESISANINNLKISFDYNFNINQDIKEARLSHTSFIKIEPNVPMFINDYMKDICYYIQNFLSLAMGKAVYPQIIKGKNNLCKKKLSDGRIVYDDIYVFYSVKNRILISKKFTVHDMLFSFNDMSGNLELYLNNWFSKADQIKPVYDLYFGTLYNPSMYIQHEFLSLIQALESYHRRMCGGKYLSNHDFCPIKKGLLKVVSQKVNDKEFKKSLENRIGFLNEYSLQERLEDIMGKIRNITAFLIHNNDDFIRDVKNTRNYLTHFDKKLEKKAKKDIDLYCLVQKMKFVIEICFLIELGFSQENIIFLVHNNQRYLQFSKYINQEKSN